MSYLDSLIRFKLAKQRAQELESRAAGELDSESLLAVAECREAYRDLVRLGPRESER